jgi:hypothetical protein
MFFSGKNDDPMDFLGVFTWTKPRDPPRDHQRSPLVPGLSDWTHLKYWTEILGKSIWQIAPSNMVYLYMYIYIYISIYILIYYWTSMANVVSYVSHVSGRDPGADPRGGVPGVIKHGRDGKSAIHKC